MENPLLTKLHLILSEIRSLAHEKPQIREETLSKFPLNYKVFLESLASSQEDPLTIEILKSLQDFLSLMFDSIRWEDRYASLYTLEKSLILPYFHAFSLENLTKILKYLEDKELRVRNQVSSILAILSKNPDFLKIFSVVFPLISIKIIEEAEKPTGRLLESFLLALREILKNWQEGENILESDYLLLQQILQKSINHPLKHIRGLGLELLERILLALPIKEIDENLTYFLTLLEIGSADNMTETRFQGTKTAGTFLLKMKNFPNYQKLDYIKKRLLPRICLNRLYPAEAFSKESLRIWKDIVELNGKQVLGSLILESTEFYLEQSLMSNWEIRETACKGFQELATKATMNNEEAKAKFMGKSKEVLKSLLNAGKDQYHMVREAAYSAIYEILDGDNGVFEGEGVLGEIFQGVIQFAGDSFHDSRKNVIEILGVLVEKNCDFTGNILNFFEEKLKGEEEHSCEKHEDFHEKHEDFHEKQEKNHENEKNEDFNENLLKIKENLSKNENIHEKQQKNQDIISEIPHFHIHKADLFDGLIAFLKELARVYNKSKPELIEKCFSLIIQHFEILHKEKSPYIIENCWKNLTEAFSLAGKVFVKKHLDEVLELVFEGISRNQGNNNQNQAIKDFLKKIQTMVGGNILKGRVEGLNGGKWNKLFGDIMMK